MDIAKQFGTDKQKEEQGIWISLGEDAEVLVARLGNKQYIDAIKRLTTPHKVALRNKSLPEDLSFDITVKAMAEAVLLGWKGMQENGKNLAYSREAAERLLKDYPDFREQIAGIAADMENFRAETEAATEKN